MAKRECLEGVIKAGGGSVSEEEALEMLISFEEELKLARESGSDLDLSKLKAENKQAVLHSLKEANQMKYSLMHDRVKKARLEKAFATKKASGLDAKEALDDIARKIESDINTRVGEATTSFNKALKDEGVFEVYNARDFDDFTVSRYISELTQPEDSLKPKIGDIPVEKHNDFKIAKVMQEHLSDDRLAEINAGGNVGFDSGHILRNRYNPILLDNPDTVAAFKSRAINDFDWDQIDISDFATKEEYVDNLVERIQGGIRSINQEDIFNFSDEAITKQKAASFVKGSITKRMGKQKKIFFKSPEKWMQWQKDFGDGDLATSFRNEMIANARQLALVDTIGTNPERVWKSFLDTAVRQSPEASKGGKNLINTMGLQYLDSLTGKLNHPENYLASRVGNAIRNYESSAHLGGLVVTQAADPLAAALRKTTILASKDLGDNIRSIADTLGEYWSGVRQAFPDEVADAIFKGQQEFWEDNYHMMAKESRFSGGAMTIDAQGRFNGGGYKYLNMAEDANDAIMRFNFGNQMTQNSLSAWYTSIARELGEMSNLPLEKLGPQKQWLQQIGLDKYWDFLRTKVLTVADNTGGARRYIDPNTFDNLTDAELKQIDPNLKTKRLLDDARRRFKTDLRSAFSMESRFRTLMPDITTDMNVALKLQKGSTAYEVANTVMQFKSYPIAFWKKSISPAWKRNKVGLASWVPYALGTNMMITWTHDAISGRSPRPYWFSEEVGMDAVFNNYVSLISRTVGYPFLDTFIPQLLSGDFKSSDLMALGGPALGDFGKAVSNASGIVKAAAKGEGGEVARRTTEAALSLPVVSAAAHGTIFSRLGNNLAIDTMYEMFDSEHLKKRARIAEKQGSQYTSHYQSVREALGLE